MASQQLNMSQSHAVVRRKFNIGITGCKTQSPHLLHIIQVSTGILHPDLTNTLQERYKSNVWSLKKSQSLAKTVA